MSKPPSHSNDDVDLFRQSLSGVTPMRQDKIQPKRLTSKEKESAVLKRQNAAKAERQASASFEFSDGFEGYQDTAGPTKYTQPGADSHEVKRLRRGDYPPDLILDLHGLKRQDAKREIAALIHHAQQQHCHCVCIVHGIGGHVLKSAVPNWLVQHPDVLAFHQAPLEWGGDGALLVLIRLGDTEQDLHRR